MEANGEFLHPSGATFDSEVMGSDQPVLVDFWAPWCPPCRMMKPVVEQLGRAWKGTAKVAFVNVDDHPDLAERFGVQGIPALMIVKDGDVVDAFTGLTAEAVLRRKMEAALQ